MKEQKLFQKDFTLVVIGQIISLFGNAILRFALPLYLLRETGSASLFGFVTACSFLPMIVLSIFGGILADRVNKRNIMVGLDFTTAIIMVIFCVVLGKVSMVPLFIITLMLLYGISGTYQPTVQASIPALVKENQVLPANAIINQVGSLAGLLGPVIGGMLYGSFGIMPILWISIVCFAASAVMEIFIVIPFQKQEGKSKIRDIVKGDLKASIHFVKHEKPVFLQVIFLICCFNLVISALVIVGIPVFVVKTLKLSDMMLGISQGAMAFGGLAGGVLTAVLGKKIKISKSYKLLAACGFFVIGIGAALFLPISPVLSFWMITILCFAAMSTATMFTVQLLSVVQIQTPPELVGKVIACMMAVSMSSQPLGQAIYGVLLDWFQTVPWVIVCAAGVISLLLSVYSVKTFRKLEIYQQ